MACGLLVCIIYWMILHTSQAISPACQCVVYDKSNGKTNGVFTSPDYPTPYRPEIRCLLYTFISDTDEIVKISFNEFDIQVARPRCIFGDYVKLFLHLQQPKVNEYTEWNVLLCGSISSIEDQIYYSSSNSLVFEFHSDWRNGNNTGFRGTYRFIKKKQYVTDGERVPDTECDYQFLSSWTNTTRGRFFSPLYPSVFPQGSKCSYRFVGYTNQRVRVIFEKVSFEYSDSSCFNSLDQIKVRDGRGPLSRVISTICSSKTYIEARSTGPDLYVEFHSRSLFPRQGFKASYLFEDIKPMVLPEVPSTEPERRPVIVFPRISSSTTAFPSPTNLLLVAVRYDEVHPKVLKNDYISLIQWGEQSPHWLSS